MKKNIKISSVILLLVILLLSNFSYAETGTFSVSKSSISLTENENTSFNITTSHCAGKFTIESSNSSVAKVSKSSVFVDGSESITITAGTTGTAKISITAVDVADDSVPPQEVTGTKTITVNVKAKETPKPSEKPTPTPDNKPQEKEINFKATNQKVYTTIDNVNLRANWSTRQNAITVPKGTELTLIGTSNEVVNGYVWYKVQYKGNTRYIAKDFITYTKPEEEKKDIVEDNKIDENDKKKSSNNDLKELIIKGYELQPKFDKNVTKYTINVGEEVLQLDITANADDKNSKVEIEGNKDFKVGENVVKIKVTAEDETTKIYTIIVKQGNVKEEVKEKELLKLSELKIKGIDFNNSFDPDIFTYKLKLNVYVEKLEVEAKANKENAKIEIIGNENFQVGKNNITILINSEDNKETATYQIEVDVPEKVEEAEKNNNMLMLIVSGVVIAIVLIISLYIYFKRRNEYDEIDNIEEDDSIEVNHSNFLSYNENKEEKNIDKNIEKNKKSKGKHSV